MTVPIEGVAVVVLEEVVGAAVVDGGASVAGGGGDAGVGAGAGAGAGVTTDSVLVETGCVVVATRVEVGAILIVVERIGGVVLVNVIGKVVGIDTSFFS